MTNPRLLQLRDEFTANRGGLDYLDALAAQEKRDLTADERTKYDGAVSRMEVIEKEIPEVLARDARYDATAAVTAGFIEPEKGRAKSSTTTKSREIVTYDPTKAGQPFRHGVAVAEMGAFARDIGRARIGRITGKVTENEYEEVLNRWEVNPTNEGGRVVATDGELSRVVAHGVAADGTAPVTIEGDLIKFVDSNRYAVNAARRLPMPDNHAPTFKRPRTTQRTTVAQQVLEGDVLSSQRLQNTGDTVTKRTEGGVLSLSEQEIDWTDPAMLGLSIEDLAESYAIDTDTVLCAAIVAAVTEATETIMVATPTAAQFITAIAASAAAVFTSARKLPDTLFASVDEWATLAGIVDTTGRPLFPIVGSQNVAGVNTQGIASFTGFNVMGLNVVVDPNFPAATLIAARASLVEFYEQNKGLLSINVPSTLEVQYAYRGYIAANVYAQALNGIEVV